METGEHDSRLLVCWDNYCRERESLARRLKKNAIPEGKKDKMRFRLEDLEERIIPALRKKIW